MSDEDQSSKTEKPTGKRLTEAREKGQVARSQEIGSLAMLSAGIFSLIYLAPWMMERVTSLSLPFVADIDSIPTDIDHIQMMFFHLGLDVGVLMAPLVALFLVVGLGTTIAQVGWTVSWEKLQFNFGAFSPLKGVKRIFGTHGLSEFLKGLLKIGVIGTLFVFITLPLVHDVELMPDFSVGAILERMRDIALHLTATTIGVMIVIAGADFAFQKYEHIQGLKMTKQEVKDEARQSEGDPKVKQRIAQLRMERAKARMMAAVAKADVVITNPTHYAVALSYEMDSMSAPKLVGKGADEIARRMREVADENEIPIVENPPLARAIYAAVELEQEIPPKYYQAVAEVISYVFRLQGRLPRKPGERLRPPDPDWSLDPDRDPTAPRRLTEPLN